MAQEQSLRVLRPRNGELLLARVVHDFPSIRMGLDDDERLARFTIRRAADSSEQPLELLQLRELVAQLSPVRGDGVRRPGDAGAFESVLDDRHVLPGRHAVQIGYAAAGLD